MLIALKYIIVAATQVISIATESLSFFNPYQGEAAYDPAQKQPSHTTLGPVTVSNFLLKSYVGCNIKGRVMGPLLAFVCPCFRKNLFVTYKIVSFCVVKVIFFWKMYFLMLGKQILQWCSFEEKKTKKTAISTSFSHF